METPWCTWSTLLVDFLFALTLLIPMLVCSYGFEPFRRGFFCNDETLMYPYRPSTVNDDMLMALSLWLPLALIAFAEFLLWIGSNGATKMQQALECCKQCILYCIGYALAIDVQEVGKNTLGRLRPNFMAVCQPQLLDGSSCSDPASANRFIEDYVCAASDFPDATIRNVRMSFPSGHTVMTTYAMVYLALYLQSRMKWRGSHIAVPVLQSFLVMIAYYVALTRISDNWHHWSDVVAGAVIGGGAAVFSGLCIAKMFKAEKSVCGEQRDLKLGKQEISDVVVATTQQLH